MVAGISLGGYLCIPIKKKMKTVIGPAKNNAFAMIFADFKEITKARLAVSVVFSSIAGYFLGADQLSLSAVLLPCFWWLLYGRS